MSSVTAALSSAFSTQYNVLESNVNNKFYFKIYAFILTAFIFGIIFTQLNADGDWNVKGEEMTIKNGMHCAIVTLATVGYGDIYPVSQRARYFVYALILAGFMIAIL